MNLRDRVAAIYTKQGLVKNGERVEILDRDRRFARVRTADGTEGWMEQRYLVPQTVFDSFQKMAAHQKDIPVQGGAVTRNDTNLHVTPGRDTDHLYQLNEGARISLLRRATALKQLPGGARAVPEGEEAPKPTLEDWWLIRDAAGHVGWVLARLLDVDIPIEVAQYSEGQRMVASFVLDKVNDGDKQVPQYLVLFTEPKDGMPYDFNQIRVFTWNLRRHRYETAYRERNLEGVLPVIVSHENFDKEGNLPVFTISEKDDQGKIQERKYKLNTPIVRRVLPPGEAAAQPVSRRSSQRH